jgi:serine/threonine protein kinase
MTMQEYEVRALRRLNPQQDVHLIRLLATYEYRGHCHLILPWADGGNLQNLWKACHPQVSSEPRDPTVARWMSVQILGLARALQKIHYCRMDRNDINSLSPNGKVQEYGRHGDLKPENILWFKGNTRSVTSEEAKFGTLKIADFGFADFHSKHSKSDVHRSAVGGYTQTYSAPEFDVTQSISPQYDIWSFGCILMQFVVWYLEGWQGVDKFSKERSQDRKGALVPTDQFFRLETRTSTGFNARAKGSVVDVSVSKISRTTRANEV